MICQRTICAVMLLCASMAVADEPVLVGDWRFDQLQGQAVSDSSSRALHGELVNPDHVTRTAGRRGGAITPIGTERYKYGGATIPGMHSLELSQGFTVEAWIRFDDRHIRQETCYIASDGAWKGPGWRFIISYDCLFIQSGDGEEMWGAGSNSSEHGAFVPGRWYHLAATFDGSVYRLYIDGIAVAESDPGLTLTRGDDTLSIGSYSGGMDSQFSGAIDHVRLWRGARPHLDLVREARVNY